MNENDFFGATINKLYAARQKTKIARRGMILAVIVQCAFLATLGYVVIHFISKFW
jgi:hypothetical protein